MTDNALQQPPARRGRLTVADRALARLLSQTVRDSSPHLRTRTMPTVCLRRRRGGTAARVRLTVCYPAPLPEVLSAARGSTDLATRSLPGSGPYLSRLEITALQATGPAVDRTAPVAGAEPVGPGRDGPPVARRRPARRRPARRPVAALLYALVVAGCALWWYRQSTGAWPMRLQNAVRTVEGWPAGGTAALACSGVLALAGLSLLYLAVAGSRVSGWRLAGPDGESEVSIDPALVERGVAQALEPLAAGRPVRVKAGRRSVLVTAPGVPEAAVKSVALSALDDAGLAASPPRVTVRHRRGPKPTRLGSTQRKGSVAESHSSRPASHGVGDKS